MHAILRLRTSLLVTATTRRLGIKRAFSAKSNDQPEPKQPTPKRPPTNLIYPESPTTNHHDLASFLADAARSGLDPNSTTYVGTHYEYTVASALSPLGFDLRRVGGVSDRGIDFLGTWSVPSSPDLPLRVVVQCKVSKLIGPNIIRELEGTVLSAPAGWRGHGAVGFLVADRVASKGMRDGMLNSRVPIGFINCDKTGRISQILWNRRAEDQGLVGMGVGLRYSSDGEAAGCVLTFNGKNMPLKKAKKAKDPTKGR